MLNVIMRGEEGGLVESSKRAGIRFRASAAAHLPEVPDPTLLLVFISTIILRICGYVRFDIEASQNNI
jgi:hypothetical protein